MLEADRVRLAEIGAQMLPLERSLAILQTERMLVQERLNSYKYPVLVLPNEIISEIFIHFLPVYPSCPPLFGALSPTLLTQICVTWRAIALNTPALWRAMAFSHSRDIPFAPQGYVAGIWLKRSGSCPPSIRPEELDEDDPISEQVLSSILPHRARWEYVRLCLSPSLISTIEGPMPLVRHLELVAGYPPTTSPLTVTRLDEAPHLRTVVLDDGAAVQVILPWAQLTSLTLKRICLYECMPALRQTQNLVHCRLMLAGSLEGVEVPDVTLPYLETLALENWTEIGEETDDIDYLANLSAPALRTLRIPEVFLGTDPVVALTSLISRSGCQLQKVRITGETTRTKEQYQQAFSSIPRWSVRDW
ncbi:hypothetical protein DFH06DRAFT_1406470 [Mycena polygramma]|nr:hypothetical protein DFH06DRAFT_1406470 [Mycena polygramma]